MASRQINYGSQSRPDLMLVTERTRSRQSLPNLVRAAVSGGVSAIQIRERDLSYRELVALTEQVIRGAADNAWIVVNGNPEVAKNLGIGLHLPERGLTVEKAREALGTGAIVGKSVHSLDSAKAAKEADYLIAGHLFATQSKPGLSPMGVELFSEICHSVECPVFAIGGINASTLKSALAAGASGIAVIGAITDSEDPELAASELRAALDDCCTAR